MNSLLIIDNERTLGSISENVSALSSEVRFVLSSDESIEFEEFDSVMSVHRWLDPQLLTVCDAVRVAGCNWFPVIIDSAAVYVGTFPSNLELSGCVRCWLARCAQLSYIGPSEYEAWLSESARLFAGGGSPLSDSAERAVINIILCNIGVRSGQSRSNGGASTFERLSLTDGLYERVSVVPVSECSCQRRYLETHPAQA